MPVPKNFHGKKGRSGRKKRSVEEAALLAFHRAVSPKDLGKMTEEMVAMFWRNVDEEEILEGGATKIVKRAVDPKIRYAIWERLIAYGIGEPTKRVETGKIGELKTFLDDLTNGNPEAETDENAVAASWTTVPEREPASVN